MPVRYTIDDRDLMITEVSGEFTVDEDLEALGEIIRKTNGDAFYKNRLFIIGSDTTFHNVDLKELERVRDVLRQWSDIYPGRDVRTAFVTRDSQASAFVKMWQAVALANPVVGSSIQLFADETDAVRWLKAK